jgi:hypothetical protein
MNTIMRLSICAGALAVAFVGLELTNREWIRELGPAVAELYQQRSRLDQEQRRRRKLNDESVCLREKAACKQLVLDDLLADRISLGQAAARFRDLELVLPTCCPSLLASLYPGSSEEERYCRQVIAHVTAELEKRDVARLDTLTAELEELLLGVDTPPLPE